MRGKLYLLPTFLADSHFEDVLPESVKQKLEKINCFFVENEKTSRRYIKKLVPSKVIDKIQFFPIGKHADLSKVKKFLKNANSGQNIGLLSEAGVPAVADPGSNIVAAAHEMDIQVIPVSGPSSILMAVMASGLGGQNFAFNGYLPIDKIERRQKLRWLEERAFKESQCQLFIETPFRNNAMFAEITQSLNPQTKLCIATDLTGETEQIICKNIAQWKQMPPPELHKRPTVFVIGK